MADLKLVQYNQVLITTNENHSKEIEDVIYVKEGDHKIFETIVMMMERIRMQAVLDMNDEDVKVYKYIEEIDGPPSVPAINYTDLTKDVKRITRLNTGDTRRLDVILMYHSMVTLVRIGMFTQFNKRSIDNIIPMETKDKLHVIELASRFSLKRSNVISYKDVDLLVEVLLRITTGTTYEVLKRLICERREGTLKLC